jgi:predicted  nucleic acid-binding Zn-ribbon protein
MDISKYLTNKDIQLSNEDINFEKLEKDIRKGYVSSDEVEKARKEALSENTKAYSELEEKYNKLEKSYQDIESRNTELSNSAKGLKLQVEMVSQGFKKEDLAEVAKLRTSLFSEEADDAKAISMIKEKYGATYFPKNTVDIPNETNFNKAEDKPKTPEITRNTSLKNLIIK